MADDIIEVVIPETNQLDITSLQHMIAQLSKTEAGESLINAMADLKKALKANPAACAMLLPEEIGEMVKALYKMTNKGILDALNPELKKEKKAAIKKQLTQDEIDSISMDDLMG
jgi:predicted transcriptional regulator